MFIIIAKQFKDQLTILLGTLGTECYLITLFYYFI